MVTLKEKEAVDYLQRARSCLHPEKDNFTNLPLLAKMLDIETTFISRAHSKDSKLALVSIDATGFPELPSWVVDIKKLLKEYDHIKTNRARSMSYFLQQVVDISTEGIRGEGGKLVRSLAGDTQVIKSLSKLTYEEREMFKDFDDPNEENSRFYTKKDNPGILFFFFSYVHDIWRPYRNDQYEDHVPNPIGLKFIDSKNSHRMPFIVFSSFNSDQDPTGLRILTPKSALRHRSEILGYREGEGVKFGPVRLPIEPIVDVMKVKTESRFSIFSNSDKPTYQYAETKLQELHPALLRTYLNLDLMSIPSANVDTLILVLPRIDEALKEAISFSERFLDVEVIPQHEAEAFKENLASKFSIIWQKLSDDRLKGPLQLAVAEALKPLRDRAEEIVKPPRRVAIQAPRKLLGLPLPRWGRDD